MALHELLMPNFPPRKDSNAKASVVLTHGGLRPEFYPAAEEAASPEGGSSEGSGTGGSDGGGDDDGLGIWQSTAAARREVAVALSACDEMAVVLAKGDGKVCVAVLENYEAPPYHVFRLRRRGTGATQGGKKGSSGGSKGSGGSGNSGGGGGGSAKVKAYRPALQWVHSSRYENKEGGMPPVPENLDGPRMRKMGKGEGKDASVNGGRLQRCPKKGRLSKQIMFEFDTSGSLIFWVYFCSFSGSGFCVFCVAASALLLDFLTAWPQVEAALAPLAAELAANAAHPPNQPLPPRGDGGRGRAALIAKGPVVRGCSSSRRERQITRDASICVLIVVVMSISLWSAANS
jgi:hypothetical protein